MSERVGRHSRDADELFARRREQLRLHALEVPAGLLAAGGQYGDAAAALQAVRADGLRESAHAPLIRVHLAEHNQSKALRELSIIRSSCARSST